MKHFTLKNACFCILAQVLMILCIACHPKKPKESTTDVVNSWVGKQIIFPVARQCSVLGEYAPCAFTIPKPYKILLYTDSSGCTSCKLRIDAWKDLIKEADTTMRGKVDFVFYFYPKNNHILHDLMKQENFREQVYIDSNDELNQLNKLPKNMDYQCFLLDKDNKVLLVGNPTFNLNIWKVQKQIVNGEIKPNNL